jgi:hypothetical protein
MKTKETTTDHKFLSLEKLTTPSKPRSLRPMRSMLAVRSLKPKTGVATMVNKPEEMTQRN